MGEPDSAPLANATLVIETAAGAIKTITTDDKGYFKVELPPGRYAIRAEKIGMRGRGCAMNDIDVTAGTFKRVKLDCDTGMR
jgi:Carboxypeptidase regulatory-like domain